MRVLTTSSGFGAPVYHLTTVTSTMEEARSLASTGAPHGSAVMTDYQSAGRGRTAGRVWHAARAESLLATVILRFSSFESQPAALTLRVGLAVARALEELCPLLSSRLRIKWPNDLLVLDASLSSPRKLCGILCESDGRTVYAGLGVNLLQRDFSLELATRATSVYRETGTELDRVGLLRAVLDHLCDDLSASDGADKGWRPAIESRLYRLGEPVVFLEGPAEAPVEVRGLLEGLGQQGELLIREKDTLKMHPCWAGELGL